MFATHSSVLNGFYMDSPWGKFTFALKLFPKAKLINSDQRKSFQFLLQ